MRIRPFHAVLPPVELAQQVASPPYDVVDAKGARRLAGANPMCFLRITRPELELPDGTVANDPAVYERARANYLKFLEEGYLAQDAEPCLFVYRIRDAGGHEQTGVMALCRVEDYASNLIRRHEKTRSATEEDRTRHILATRIQAGPVFLMYRDDAVIAQRLADAARGEPLYDVSTPEGARHTIWRVPEGGDLGEAFERLSAAYIADGHHRAAAALRVSREHAHEAGLMVEADWFLAALFPVGELRILAYNRVISDLGGLSADEFLGKVRGVFEVSEGAPAVPEARGGVSMYLGGRWYGLGWPVEKAPDLVASLDVSVLQDRLLAPVLGITDPRLDPRVSFVGGVHGTGELERRVREGEAALAFSLYPTSPQQLMAVADAGEIMPPKSTWFEPKLRSGLLIHPLD